MARGDFHTKDLEARLVQQGATQLTYKGSNFFGTEATAILFLNSSIAVAGSAPELRPWWMGRAVDASSAPRFGSIDSGQRFKSGVPL